ncbi:MAG: hypothetical protein GY713_00615 [Actinomycetia bacterium]|nr:hypothetical protein [Actinomycetes bacterium]
MDPGPGTGTPLQLGGHQLADRLFTAGLVLILLFVGIALLAPLVVSRPDLVSEGTAQRINQVYNYVPRNWMLAAVAGAGLAALAGFGARSRPVLLIPSLIAGFVSLFLAFLAGVGPSFTDGQGDWLGEWDGDYLTVWAIVGLMALAAGVASLAAAVALTHQGRPVAVLGWLAGAVAGAAVVATPLVARTKGDAEAHRRAIETTVIEHCDGSPSTDLARNVGPVLLLSNRGFYLGGLEGGGSLARNAAAKLEPLHDQLVMLADDPLTISGTPVPVLVVAERCPGPGSVAETVFGTSTSVMAGIDYSYRGPHGRNPVFLVVDGRLVVHEVSLGDLEWLGLVRFREIFEAGLVEAGLSP